VITSLVTCSDDVRSGRLAHTMTNENGDVRGDCVGGMTNQNADVMERVARVHGDA